MISWTRARCAASSLIDAFQPILERPVADVLVIGGVNLFLGHQETPGLRRVKAAGKPENTGCRRPRAHEYSGLLASVPNRSAPSVIRAMGDHSLIGPLSVVSCLF